MSKLNPSAQKGKEKRKPDPYYPAAVQNAKDAARRLQEAGIIDAEGRRIRKDLPPDMREVRIVTLAADATANDRGRPPGSGKSSICLCSST